MNLTLQVIMGVSMALLVGVPLILAWGWWTGREKPAYARNGIEEYGVKFVKIIEGIWMAVVLLLAIIMVFVVIIAGVAGWVHLIHWLIT